MGFPTVLSSQLPRTHKDGGLRPGAGPASFFNWESGSERTGWRLAGLCGGVGLAACSSLWVQEAAVQGENVGGGRSLLTHSLGFRTHSHSGQAHPLLCPRLAQPTGLQLREVEPGGRKARAPPGSPGSPDSR